MAGLPGLNQQTRIITFCPLRASQFPSLLSTPATDLLSPTFCQVHLIPGDHPATPPRLLCRRTEGLEYFVEHHSGRLLVLGNAQGAENYALFRCAPVSRRGAFVVVVISEGCRM